MLLKGILSLQEDVCRATGTVDTRGSLGGLRD
jgi:hypothetical protein